jgi:hypothetical protein
LAFTKEPPDPVLEKQIPMVPVPVPVPVLAAPKMELWV